MLRACLPAVLRLRARYAVAFALVLSVHLLVDRLPRCSRGPAPSQHTTPVPPYAEIISADAPAEGAASNHLNQTLATVPV